MPNSLTLSDLVPGSRVGPYILSSKLAPGSLGVTFRARDMELEREVALKVLRPEYLSTGSYVEAFLPTARAIIALRHPNIAPIFTIGRQGEIVYFCRTYVEGETLAGYIEQKRRLDEEQARVFLRQAASALGMMHQAGIVHLGVKPANLLVDRANNILLSDFGLADETGEDADESLQRPIFTPAYVSPEQITHGVIDQRTDIYSLGVTFFHLLVGRPPFAGATPEDVISAHLQKPFPEETARGANLSTGWIHLLMRMMARAPGDRFADCRELLSALENVEEFRYIPRVHQKPVLGASSESFTVAAGAAVLPLREEKPLIHDEDVQFTVYRPKVIAPQKWHTLLAFAHLSEKPPEAPESEPSPREEVVRQAKQILADQAANYRDATQDSGQAIPRQGELTFLPEVEGIEFNPLRRTFLWEEPVHREEFRIRAVGATHDPAKMLRGRMTVFLGAIIVADIPLTFRVDAVEIARPTADVEQSHARPYRKIFTSYSHQDTEIVEQVTHYASVAGDEYLRDALHLRSGQEWNRELLRMIDEADVFQLFWSSHSMKSIYVKQEWEHALALGRPHFIRPIYWEDPFPNMPGEGLPPESLTRLHFQKIRALETEDETPPERSPLSLDQARDLIGVSPGASRREIEEAFRWQFDDLKLKVERAPTSALKEKFRRTQHELETAWEIVGRAGGVTEIPTETRRPVEASSSGGASRNYPGTSAPRSGGGGSSNFAVWGIVLVVVILITAAVLHFL